MRIRVIRFSSLGDCILLCPFLEHLKVHGVENISVITKAAYIELFAAARGVDEIIALGTRAGYRGIRQIIAAHRSDRCVVIDAHNTIRSRVVAVALGGARTTVEKYYARRLGMIFLKRRAAIPSVTARYGALGEALGFPPLTSHTGGVDIPDSARRRVQSRLAAVRGEYVTVAPGGRWPAKRWGADKFAALARHIIDAHGYHVVLLGDPADEASAAHVAAALGEHATSLVGQTGIMDAAAAILGSVAFVGNDSGLMHLAEAVGIRVLAVFGPTVEAFGYYPSLQGSRVVERAIDCRPCSRNGSSPCPRGTHECMTGIPVRAMRDAFDDLVQGRQQKRYAVS